MTATAHLAEIQLVEAVVKHTQSYSCLIKDTCTIRLLKRETTILTAITQKAYWNPLDTAGRRNFQ